MTASKLTYQNAGEGFEVALDGNIMHIRVDLSREGTPSGSGKSDVLASTRGNLVVPGTDVTFGGNVYRKRKASGG